MNILKKIIVLVVAVSVSSSFLFAGNAKSSSKYEIQKAKKLYKKVMNDKKLQIYIPYLDFSRGFQNLKEATHQFKDESEYEKASFHAVTAAVQFETALYISKSNKMKYDMLVAERDYYKKAAKKEMLKVAIISASLEKKGRSYRGNTETKKIFKRRTNTISNGGKKIFSKIYEVLKLYPKSKIVVKGHTRYGGSRNMTKSAGQAKAISEYLITELGLKEKRISTEGMGNTQPVEVKKYGRMRMVTQDRIEIIITGVTD